MEESIVLRNLREKISQSCDFDDAPSLFWQEFHKDFLKTSLDALDISIDYQKKCVISWSAKPVQIDASTIYKLRDSVNPQVCYDDLEATLLGCIRTGMFFIREYEKLLKDYSQTERTFKRESLKTHYL